MGMPCVLSGDGDVLILYEQHRTALGVTSGSLPYGRDEASFASSFGDDKWYREFNVAVERYLNPLLIHSKPPASAVRSPPY